MKADCATRIKEALAIRGLKQADLCSATGILKSTMSQYVSGKYEPSQLKLELIARALNVDEAWLMGYDVPMERKKPAPGEEDELSKAKKALLQKVKQLSDEEVDQLLQIAEVMFRPGD